MYHPIPNYPGYALKEDATVWSRRKRMRLELGRGFAGVLTETWHQIKPIKTDRYWRVRLYQDKKLRDLLLHRLVASVFIPNPDNKPEVAHNDGNKDNCHPSNLRWATHEENESDKIKHNTLLRGDRHPGAKMNSQQVKLFRLLRTEFKWKWTTIAQTFNLPYSTVSKVFQVWKVF